MTKGRLSCDTRGLITLPVDYSHQGIFAKLLVEDEIWASISRINVWTDGTDIYYSSDSTQYVKENGKWVPKTWAGLTSFNGEHVWTDGTNIYYSLNDAQYILNKDTSTWEPTTWMGYSTPGGGSIWTDGVDIYCSGYSAQYVLNDGRWVTKTWSGMSSFYGRGVWSDGTNIYYSYGTTHKVLNGSTWEDKEWVGPSILYAEKIWMYGDDIYHNNYKLVNGEWELQDFGPLDVLNVWTDGSNIYGTGTILLPSKFNRAYVRKDGTWVPIDQTSAAAPTGSLTVTTNRTVDVTDYAQVVVNVPSTPKTMYNQAVMNNALRTSSTEVVGSIYVYKGEASDTYEYDAMYKLCTDDSGTRYFEKLVTSESTVVYISAGTYNAADTLDLSTKFIGHLDFTAGGYDYNFMHRLGVEKLSYGNDDIVSPTDVYNPSNGWSSAWPKTVEVKYGAWVDANFGNWFFKHFTLTSE